MTTCDGQTLHISFLPTFVSRDFFVKDVFISQVDIKLNINKPIRSVERLESVASQSDTEESEFDPDAIITPKIDVAVLDRQKPRLKGKKLTEWPARQQDKDLSGLCSIM